MAARRFIRRPGRLLVAHVLIFATTVLIRAEPDSVASRLKGYLRIASRLSGSRWEFEMASNVSVSYSQ